MALVWGVSFVVMKQALEEISPVLLLAIRFSLATVVLIVTCALGSVAWTTRGGGWILLTGVLLAGGYVLQTTGLRHTSAGKSGFLTGLYVVLLPLFTSLVYKSAPQPREWIGVTVTFLGMIAMNWDGTSWRWGLGESLTVGCAVLFAFHLLALDRAVQEMDSRWAGLAQIAIAGAVLWAWLPVGERPQVVWSSSLVSAIGFTAVLATALPFTLMAWAQQHTTPVRTGLLLSLEMPFAALAGWWWLQEPFRGTMLLGAILMLAGILLVELKPGGAPVHLDEIEAPRL